jgi:BASS family bile acid:Na+ symporter
VIVDVVLLPLVVWTLVELLTIPDGYAIGLLLVGIASAGPRGIKAAQHAGADVAPAVALVVVREVLNLAAIPFWAAVLLPSGTEFDVGRVIGALVLVVLLPLFVGTACRRWAPGYSAGLTRGLNRLADVALAVVIVSVVVRDADSVTASIGDRVPLVACIAVVAALALGWLAGGPEPSARAAAALVTGIRANGVALAVAAASFADRPDVRSGVVDFSLFSVTLPLAAAAARGYRRSSASAPV